MILSICIPTLNRSVFLKKNLNHLKNIIDELGLNGVIEIVVSNNNSDDDTQQVVDTFYAQHHQCLNLSFYKQESRLIMQESLLFVVSKSKADHFMWLGDDDYISKDYLQQSIGAIQDMNVGCIIPSYSFINEKGEQLVGGRDLRKKNKAFIGGFSNCVRNSWRGHQLSGLVTKTSVLQAYRENKVDNIYPCIYFNAMGCLNFNTMHLAEHPIQVTLVDQSKKAWNYGRDGLLNDIFDNYKKLPLSGLKKTILQLYFFRVQYWRLWGYLSQGNNSFLKASMAIMFCENATVGFTVLFPVILLERAIMFPLIRTVKKLIKKFIT